MSEPVETGVLRATLRQARNAARQRLALRVLLDGTVLVATVLAGAALLAGWTRRGDLASTGASVTLVVGALALLGQALAHARRRFGTDHRTAKGVAAYDASLGPADSPQRASEHRLLRHELLGAWELAESLGQESRGPHAGSPKLAAHYIADVAHRLCADDINLRRALPGPRWRPRLLVAALVLGGLAVATRGPLADGFGLLLAGVDARPPTPPEPVWSALRLRLHYPEHTGRPVRDVPNPSGALRVPAGTEVEVDLDARLPAEAARVVVIYDAEELSAAPPPEVVSLESDDQAGLHFTGTFTVRATGTWTVVLLDDSDDSLEESARRSTALPVHEEPDRAPEIELLPLPRDRREVRETDRVEIRMVARDDFGLRSAVLVYQLPNGDSHRLPIKAPKGARRWRRSYDWDISQIPVVERSEVLYWIEIRDNDPGLGLHPLPDPPGKLSRSATQRLLVHDDEAEHAANIVRLRDIRDLAVDLLAARMLSRAFPAATPLPGAPPPPPDVVRAALARDLLHRASQLLARLAEAIDALSLDTLARERDVATLTEVHHRLAELHGKELALHAKMPPESELTDPEGTKTALDSLADHNTQEVERLEDELIRLDDLVDGQIIERLEALVARLETTQRSMVDLLEQLKAGDQSVRPRIEQLEQRRKEDLRRISEARAMLRKEVDQEFMNLDAFSIVERMKQQPPLTDMLDAGNLDAALEQARGQLGEVQGLRDEVQKRLGEEEEASTLSPEERDRMKLLRELSKLQDEQTNLRSQTRKLHEQWREGVAAQTADEDDRETATTESKALRESLDEINDARLGREGRRALDDAKDALEQLDRLSEDERASALDLAEAAEEAARALERATEGSQAKEREGKAVRRARDRAKRLQKRLDESLPSPQEVLSPEQAQQLQSLRERQAGLRKQSRTLLDDPVADQLPGPGRKAMRQADKGMERSANQLARKRPGEAIDPEAQAWQGLQDAIDSLRRGPPPPPPSASGDASTEAERDRSLRDALMEAMREDAPTGFDEPVQRYYEELLR